MELVTSNIDDSLKSNLQDDMEEILKAAQITGYRSNRYSFKENKLRQKTETIFKEKHGVWDPMPELIMTSPYVNS
jgi:hypothetical protein